MNYKKTTTDDLVYCETCNEYTNQFCVEEIEGLVTESYNSLWQKFQCNVCKRNNERVLQECWYCKKHTNQDLVKEEKDPIFPEELRQEFRCKVCLEINETGRSTDENIERWIDPNNKDEEDGVDCTYCMRYKKQTLLDKQPFPDDYNKHRLYLTTYKCKTCGTINYGTVEKKDIC